MMRLTKEFAKKVAFNSGLYKITRLDNRFYVLAYHMISDEPNGFYPETATNVFESQIVFLAKNYKIMSLEEIVKRLKSKRSVRSCVAITFDDGFRDNYEKAYPILKKYGVPATIFLSTGWIGVDDAPWFIKLRYLFLTTKQKYAQITLGENMRTMNLRNSWERREASNLAMSYMKALSYEEKICHLESLGNCLGVSRFEGLDKIMLSWDEIKEMGDNGITFGAHTVNHPCLSAVPDQVKEREIRVAKEMIESVTGIRVTTFAYPFGKKQDYDYSVISILRKFGFTCAATTNKNVNRPSVDVFELNRSEPWEVASLIKGNYHTTA